MWSSSASAFPHSLTKGCALKPTAQPTAPGRRTRRCTRSTPPTQPTPSTSHHRTHGLEPSLANAAQPHHPAGGWGGGGIPTPEPTSRRLRPLTTPPACISRSPPRRPRIALVVCPPSSRPSQTCRPPRRRTARRAFRHPRPPLRPVPCPRTRKKQHGIYSRRLPSSKGSRHRGSRAGVGRRAGCGACGFWPPACGGLRLLPSWSAL